MDDSLVPECAQKLEEKYGDLAAFSTTSAATDLVTFISEYGNDFSTTVYGVGDGSRWVERAMHLDPAEVTGYVLDNIATTVGVPPNQFLNASSMGGPFSEVAETILDLCDEDAACRSRFKKMGLKATLKHLMAKLDKNPNSKCAKALKTAKTNQDDDPPSFVLRYLLGALISQEITRTLVPAFVYRILRCAQKDVDVLKFFMEVLKKTDSKNEDTAMMSFILDNLILGSEGWESPTPSVSEMKERIEAATLDLWASYTKVPTHCAYSKEKSPACDKLKLGNYKGNGIIYERDEYWNKAAKIPDQASVMIMSSEMDPNSPSQYSEYQLAALEGEKKKLFTFKYTAGSNVVDGQSLPICGMKLLATFVTNEGDFSKMNTTCFEKDAQSTFNWTVPTDYLYAYMSTDDAFDGEFDLSLSEKVKAEAEGSAEPSSAASDGSLSLWISGSGLAEVISFLSGSKRGSVDSLEAHSKAAPSDGTVRVVK
ncbi:hypothetical protein V7S43_004619 [Phytophthora oleae]|uniref:Uncharacterized protein n=1 Tax=Phytophthora oleae TaxID=2107226 RepID=A0ABD3FTS7_9STRA